MAGTIVKWIGGVVAGLATVVMLLVWPFALNEVAGMTGVKWASLADIGEAYGSAVALLTAASLLVLAVSVAFQVRAARISADATARMLHLELMHFVMEDPSLVQVEGIQWDGTAQRSEHLRQWVYANMQLAHFRTMYDLKEQTAAELRMQMAARFTSRIGRQHWESNRTWYRAGARRRHDRQFCDIVDEEYEKAVRAGEATAERYRASRGGLRRELVVGGAMLTALAAGVLLGRGRSGRV
ncbi:DUF6082 family protein [Nonomuraea sp. NPDC049646]|uniref:DUF6082 family protein n=1 Tax=unclassified Nonomuraea TaxID=2593643 RepID=UPI0037A46BC6